MKTDYSQYSSDKQVHCFCSCKKVGTIKTVCLFKKIQAYAQKNIPGAKTNADTFVNSQGRSQRFDLPCFSGSFAWEAGSVRLMNS